MSLLLRSDYSGDSNDFFCTTTNLNILTCAIKVVVGCKNDVGGFYENLMTFRDSKVPDFRLALKMRLKKCSSWVP